MIRSLKSALLQESQPRKESLSAAQIIDWHDRTEARLKAKGVPMFHTKGELIALFADELDADSIRSLSYPENVMQSIERKMKAS